jgi:thiamine-monophosphate kinase
MRRIALGAGREFELIESFLVGTQTPDDIIVPPGDDCAVVSGPRISLSIDLCIEGVHFRRDWLTPEEIGYRCAAAALSDLAAMAAAPIGILVALGLADTDVPDTAQRIMKGAREACDAVGAALLGGDVARSPQTLVVDVCVAGRVQEPVLRSGARPGDSVWVSGLLGGSNAAVRMLSEGRSPGVDARMAYAHPLPRIAEARWLAERVPLHAMIDISDGLASDAAHIAIASGAGITLDATTVPIHPAVLRTRGSFDDHLTQALTGGDDYELCFTAPPGSIESVQSEFERAHDVPLARVGSVDQSPGVRLRGPNGSVVPLDVHGYRHFT